MGSATKYWYPHHIEKYRRKTGHLTIAEHGAYRLLMDAYWDRRGPLPIDETRLRKLIGADKEEWDSVRDAVLAFFKKTDEGWRHDKIDEQIAEAEEKHKAKVAALAKARAAKQGNGQDSEQSTAHDTGTGRKTGKGTSTQSQSQSPKQSGNIKSNLSSATPRAREGFDVLIFLNGDDLEDAKRQAPRWDIYHLAKLYNDAVASEKLEPPRVPRRAFPAWCKKFTKGKPPPGVEVFDA